MTLDSNDLRALVDIGFIAWSRGLTAQAAKIFEAVRLKHPDQEAGFIGSALVELNQGNADRAVELLRSIPPTDTARAFLGLALLSHGERGAATEVLNEVAEAAAESPAGRMARTALESLGSQTQP